MVKRIRCHDLQTTAFLITLFAIALFISGCTTAQPTPNTVKETPPPEKMETAESIAQDAPLEISPEKPVEETKPTTPPNSVESLYLEVIGIAYLDPADLQSKNIEEQEPKFIEATGYGFPAPNATNELQKMVTAMEAAHYRALANLAEKHQGLEVHRTAKTVDMAFAEETVNINLSATLSGVSETERNYDEHEAMAMVSLQMMLPIPPAQETPEEMAKRRKTQAETAARLHAAAQLREKVSKVESPTSKVLQDIQYAEALWTSDLICEVKASLRIDSDDQNQNEANIEATKTTSDESL